MAQVVFLDLIDIDAVIPYLPVLYIIKTIDQIGDRSLSRAGTADKGDLLSRRGE